MRRKFSNRVTALVLGVLSAPAFAQAPADSGFDAHGFRLAAFDADARDPLVVVRPGRFAAQSWFVGGVVEYASQPLILEPPSGQVIELDSLVGVDLSGGYAPHERVRIDLAVPLFFYAEGADGSLGAGLGDVRATALVNLVSPDDEGGVGLGLVLDVDVPTGRPGAYLGQYGAAGGLGLAATYEGERLTLTLGSSTQLRPHTDPAMRPAPTRGGDALTWGGGVGYLVSENVGMNIEVHGEVAFDPDVRRAIGLPAETVLSLRQVREDGAFITAGLGTALSRGAGSSPLRLLIGGGFGKLQLVQDADGDGVDDEADACPEQPETFNNFKDADGCPDALPVMVFRAIGLGGKVREDASLSVTAPVAMEGVGKLEFQGAEAMPGSEWEVRATAGNCLAGSASVTMGPEGDAVDIQMTPIRDALLQVEVVDREGVPVPGAVVVVRSDDGPCVPNAAIPLGGNSGSIDVGPGQHNALVTAEGYRMLQEGFEVGSGETHTIRAVLVPTKIKIVGAEIQILERVYFETGAATILGRSFELLDEVAEVVRISGITKIEVQGHTDSQGEENMNLDLSQRRAEAVRAYLSGKGIPEGALVAKGYGEAVPLESNATSAGRAKNRRVEFRILEQQE